MKNNIYILGIICLVIILISVLFKASHLAGAGILLFAGLGATSLLFIPTAYFKLRKSTDDSLLRLVYFAAFISFTIDFLGALFKIMHWPGAEWFLIIGIPLPFVFFLPIYITYHTKRKLKTDLGFFAILLFMIYVGIFSALLALSPQAGVNKNIALSTNTISVSNNYLNDGLNSKPKSIINDKSKELVKKLEQLKLSLIAENSKPKTVTQQLSKNIDYTQIENLEVQTSLTNQRNQKYIEFNDMFEEFSIVLKKEKIEEDVIRLIDEIDVYRKPMFEDQSSIIEQMSLIGVLNTLTDWQNKILLIEHISNS